MPFAEVNLVRLHYQVLGNSGPWVALVSGARRSMEEVRGLATLVTEAGFQVLLHDRRNTGQSSLSIEGEGSEFEIWADDLCALAKQLDLPPFVVGGSSSGCRLATILALRHRAAIQALLMMRVTGGAFAVKRLSNIYYTQYIEAAQRGGMTEVCETDHFRDLIAIDPARRTQIMQWDTQKFLAVMNRWRDNKGLFAQQLAQCRTFLVGRGILHRRRTAKKFRNGVRNSNGILERNQGAGATRCARARVRTARRKPACASPGRIPASASCGMPSACRCKNACA